MIEKEFVQAFTGLAPNDGPVTLYSITGTTTASGDAFNAGTSYSHGWRHPPSYKDQQQAQLLMVSVDVKWTLMDNGEVLKPKIGDYITDAAGDTWRIVLDVKKTGRDAFYDCMCQRNAP